MSRFLQPLFWVLPLLALAACSDFMAVFAPKPKPSPVSREMQSERYLLNLALLQLELATDPSDAKAVQAHVKALNTYTAGNKKNKKEVALRVLALSYKTSDGTKQAVLTPVPMDKGAQFAALKKVVQELSAVPHTLYDVRAYMMTLVPAETPAFSKDDTTRLREQLKMQQEKIIDDAVPLSVSDNAPLQLGLVKFFMENRQRDAAYLAMENAKQALASMPEDATLSKEAAAIEETLHRQMPYKL